MEQQKHMSRESTFEALPTRVVRMKEVSHLIGLSRSTIYDRLNPRSTRYDPSFPKPLKIGVSAVGWSLEDIMLWIKNLQ